MTPHDRLRVELDALERSAPDGVAPSTSQSRRMFPTRVAKIGATVLAGLAIGAGVVYVLERSPKGTDATDLRWSSVQWSASGVLDSITVLNGRLFIAGADDEGPAVWTSEDGFGWARASVTVRSRPNREADFLSMGNLARHGEQLVAIGHRRINDGTSTHWEAALWTSEDGGRTWVDALENSLPQGTLDVVASEQGYVALGQGLNGIPAVWTSQDGLEWSLESDALTFGDASVEALAVHNGQIVAVGVGLSQAGSSPAMAWHTRDGASWLPVTLGSGDLGRAADVIATDTGFIAVGTQQGTSTSAIAWQSDDGITWHEVVLNSDADIGAGFVAQADDQFVAIGGELLEQTTGRTKWFVLSPSRPALPLEFEGEVRGMAGYGDRYVGIGVADCGGLVLYGMCPTQLIWGLPPGTQFPERLGSAP